MKEKKTLYLTMLMCIVVELCIGILFVWSIFRANAIEFYGWDEGSANLVSGFMLFAFCAGNFIGGAVNNALGSRRTCILGAAPFVLGIFLSSLLGPGSSVVLFYLTYCIIGGLGCGIAYGAILACMEKWLPHRVGLATGIATGSFGFGAAVFGPVVAGLLKNFPINTVLRILSVIFLIACFSACALIRLPDKEYLDALPAPKRKPMRADQEDVPLSKAVRRLPFWCLLASTFFYNAVWNMLNPLIKDLGMARGLSETTAVLLVSLTGVLNALGRLSISSVSDRLGRIKPMLMLDVVTIFCGLMLMVIGGPGYFIIVLLTAFAYGGPAAVHPALVSDFFGIKYTGVNYGVIMMGLGFSSVFFNTVSNALYAWSGSYYLTFIMGAVGTGGSLIAMIYLHFRVKRKQAAEGRL